MLKIPFFVPNSHIVTAEFKDETFSRKNIGVLKENIEIYVVECVASGLGFTTFNLLIFVKEQESFLSSYPENTGLVHHINVVHR